MPGSACEVRRLWLFDIDGTLVAQSEDQLDAWVVAFGEIFGMEIPPRAIAAHLGLTFAEVVQVVAGAQGRQVPPPRIPEALAVYTRHVCSALARRPPRLLPGAQELLEFLRGRGDLVGVVTGNFREEGELKLKAVGLRDRMHIVVFSDLSAPGREALVRRALAGARADGFSGSFADTVVVGDSVHDVDSAHRTGAVAVAVCTGLTPRRVLAQAGPDLLVSDLPALLARLRQTDARWVVGDRPE